MKPKQHKQPSPALRSGGVVGPDCPTCKRPMRRRKYWERWDTVRCAKCGTRMECIEASFGRPSAWVSTRAVRPNGGDERRSPERPTAPSVPHTTENPQR